MPTVRTVAKASYTPTSKDGKGRAKAGLRYYAHRPDQEKLNDRDRDHPKERARDQSEQDQDNSTSSRRAYREAFTHSPDDSLNLKNADRFIDDSPGKYAYRIVLSPDPEWGQHMHKEDLKSWTREVMQELQDKRQQDIPYLAYVHQDPKHPHVHVVAMTETTLRKDDLTTLRQSGDREAERMLGMERQGAEPYQQRLQEPDQALTQRQEQMMERLERALQYPEPEKFHDKLQAKEKEREKEEEKSKSYGIDLGY
jgi:hypothetical protein